MAHVILLVIAVLILLLCLAVFGFFYSQLKAKARQAVQPALEEGSQLGTCARCQQRRLLVKKEDGLCAYCWSSLNTKQIG
jgi:type II secretory pathway pseudopilin PulG